MTNQTEHMLETTDPDTHWPTHLLEQMARDVEYVNRLNGWYDDERTFFDELWLLASEIFEAGEAWRVAGFEDQTTAEQVLYGRGDHGEDRVGDRLLAARHAGLRDRGRTGPLRRRIPPSHAA